MTCRLFSLIAALLITSPHLTLLAQEPIQVAPPAASDQPDNGSYLVGFNVGRDLLQNGFNEKDFVMQHFVKGVLEALAGKPPALSNAEIEAAGTAITTKLQARHAEAVKQRTIVGQANAEKSKAFLAENAKKDGVQSLKNGLQYLVLKKGQGKSPGLTNTVRVHYSGSLINGEEFDSSIKRNRPFDTLVGGEIIAGWQEALQRMVVGDKWKLYIPPELAYGPEGRPPVIGPNETLIFELELLEIVK